MSEIVTTPVLIIGSGPAGATAAIYAARAARNPIMVQGMQPGGQLTITTEVENYPGFPIVQGPELMEAMLKQVEHVGGRIEHDHIREVDLSKRPFRAVGESGKLYDGETLIIATGAQARWLGIPTEKKFSGFGVSACATCDGFFYKNQDVLVIGGGNSAVEEALFLTNFAKKVTLIHRRDELRADKTNQNRLFKHPKIEVIWDTELEEVLGTENPLSVTGARLRNVKSGETSEIAVQGIFVAIGHTPNTGLFKGQLEMDDEGYILTKPDSTRTSVEGVYAAGDVQDKVYRQAVTAAGTGCMAALEAEKFLAGHE